MSERTCSAGRELLLLLFMAAILHAVVLWLIFPGYYRPLWPHHSDFYIALAFAHDGLGITDYIRFPRPVGALFFYAIGMLGIHGMMLVIVVLVLLNVALIGGLLRRVFGIELSPSFVLAFSGYALLVFAHPYFYSFATFDVMAQLSLLFLLLAAACWMRAWSGRLSFPLGGVAFALCMLAFLAKETYGLSAALVAAAAGLSQWSKRRYGALLPLAGVLVALVSGLVVNRLNGSPFTGGGDVQGTAYYIDLSPASLIGQWLRYASDGLNSITVAVLFGAIAILLTSKDARIRWAAVVLPVAGALAWLPNAALPNHYFPGYSWGAADFLFTPFLLLSLKGPSVGRGWLGLAGVVLALVGIQVSGPGVGAQWVLEQEARQRRLLGDLERLLADLPQEGAGGRILVTGLNFPFSPFDHALALRSVGPVKGAQFDVVRYVESGPGIAALSKLNDARSFGVRFVTPTEVSPANFTQVWAFRSNGSLVRKAVQADYEDVMRSNSETPGVDFLIYPGLFDVFSPNKDQLGAQELGYRLLSCGGALLAYENLNAARGCLERSVVLIPENPYPAYYLGQVDEKQGRLVDAKRWYERAVETDDRKAPNPAFAEAVKRVVGTSPITK